MVRQLGSWQRMPGALWRAAHEPRAALPQRAPAQACSTGWLITLSE